MTKIDRYILLLFLRMVFVCFLSLAGIFIVFHAFTAFDDLVAQTKSGESLAVIAIRFYGPYLILLFDMTGAIITLMAFLFTVGWLRRTGELTATLSAGISHGRIFRPMVIASLIIISGQLISRELIIPQFRNSLTMKAENLNGENEQAVRPTFDRSTGILIEGARLRTRAGIVTRANFRIDSDYGDFGDLLIADEAVWQPATMDHPDGYLLENVKRPRKSQLDRLGRSRRSFSFIEPVRSALAFAEAVLFCDFRSSEHVANARHRSASSVSCGTRRSSAQP